MSSIKINQSDEHQNRHLFIFACGAIVSPYTLFIAAAWGASRNAIHTFYSVAVRDALSLRSVLSLFTLYLQVSLHYQPILQWKLVFIASFWRFELTAMLGYHAERTDPSTLSFGSIVGVSNCQTNYLDLSYFLEVLATPLHVMILILILT